ncbi:hypothetical protein ACE5IS_02040 [Leptospira wolffii]|uniref:Lipoprotein n=1 Tax=Leptospira wolffii TaxID=409998 RepID=A0ABV5BK16_9LEPT
MKKLVFILIIAFALFLFVDCFPEIQRTALAAAKASENGTLIIRYVSDARSEEQEITLKYICLSESDPKLTLSLRCGGKLLFYNEKIKLGEERKFFLGGGNYTGRIMIDDRRGILDETVIGLIRFSNIEGNSTFCNPGIEMDSLPLPFAEKTYFNYLNCTPLLMIPGKKTIIDISVGSQVESYFWSWLFRKIISSGLDSHQGYLRYSSFSIRYE